MLVRPMITAPAALRRATTGASAAAGGLSSSAFDPAGVTSPAMSKRSLIDTGMPASGGVPTRLPRWAAARRGRAAGCEASARPRVAEPDRIAAVVLDRVRGQRVDQYVEPLAVQHQVRHDTLKLVGLENDQRIADRV